MIEHIGRLRADGGLVQRGGGDREFDRLFAEFAGAMGGAFVEEAAGIGGLRARLGALIYRPRKLVQSELAPALFFSPIAPLSPVAAAAATRPARGPSRAS